jgi:hypothetical protein
VRDGAGFPCSGLTLSFFHKFARLVARDPEHFDAMLVPPLPCALGKDASSSEVGRSVYWEDSLSRRRKCSAC